MKIKKRSKIYFLIVFYLLPSSFFLFSGCVRLTGGAGVWKQGTEDAVPTSHEVGFDTQQLVPQSSQAKITT